MIGFGKRISYATRCFFSVLSRGEVPDDIAAEVVKAPEVPVETQAPTLPAAPVEEKRPAEESSDRAVQILALL